MIWMLPIAGAVGGALLNRRQPLKGALMGGLLGAGAGAAAPALMGAAGGAGAAGAAGSYAPAAFGTAAGYGGTGAATAMPAASSAGGILGGMKAAGGYVPVAMQAMQAANMAQGLMGQDRPVEAPQMPMAQTVGPQALSQLSQATDAQTQQSLAEQMKRRMSNQQIIQQMMGRNYG